MAIDRVDAYLEAHREDFEDQLKALLRIPSISAQPDHDPDTRRAAEFLVDDFHAMGLANATLIETKGHPLVYAESLEAPGRPTVLI
jgi:acetylornithine deacetylase/succinyl-diaminopimelate desuccinylase-like protein